MPAARHLPSLTALQRSAQRQRSAGFSLAEVLVGTGILTGAVIMAAAMNGVAGFGLLGSTTVNSRDALIDADVAAIRGVAEAYTWCSGTGSLQAAGPCLGVDPKSPAYYAPPASNPRDNNPNNIAMEAFEAACTNANANETLNGTLIAAINGRPALPGINRTAEPVAEDGTPTNRIRIRYTSSDAGANADPIFRSVELTPTVAAWCS